MEKDNDKIYYYTSDYVFLEWLKNETIWATRSVTSNDASETTYVIRHLERYKEEYPEQNNEINKAINILNVSKNFSLRVYKDIIKDFIDKRFDKFKEYVIYAYDTSNKINSIGKGEVPSEYILFTSILMSLTHEDVEKYFNVDYESFFSLYPVILMLRYPYIISFTYCKDNRFLWDSYTNNCGVCLEFSKKELTDYIKLKGLLDEDNNEIALIDDIKYDDESQKVLIDEFFNSHVDAMTYKNNIDILNQISALCKNPYWKPEKECRAVFMANYFNDSTFEVNENYNLKYNNGCKTQDYIPIPIPKSLLKGITTGPMNSEKELRKYIEDGLDKDIENDKARNSIWNYFNGLKVEKSIGKGVINK